MPNRIIKESICRSDSIDSLSWFEEVLFYRLIVVCDDYGRFDGRAAIIKGSCFPLKDVTVKQIDKSLNKLVSVGLVRVYEACGRPFLQMSTWEKHQQIRAKKSKFPAPDETCNQLISDDINCHRNRESKYENRNTRIETENARASEGLKVRLVEDFISAYPKDCNRYLTESAYCGLILDGVETEDNLVACAKNYAEACRINETPERYIKNAENFLKEFVFEKYLPEKYKKPTNNFGSFEREYDFEQLERKLLGGE